MLGRAPAAQALSVLITVAFWSVALTEIYRGLGQVPVVHLALSFRSCFLVHVLELPAGILLGYQRQ